MILSSKKLGLIYALLVLLFPFVYKVLGWYDEFIVVLSAIIFLFKKNKSIHKLDAKIILLVLVLGLIGALSNINSGLTNNLKSCISDYFALYKTFLILVFTREIFDDISADRFVRFLLPICKLYIYICAITGIFSQFIDIGMATGERRYGIRPFGFVFYNNVFPTTILISYMVVYFSQMKYRSKQYLFYLVALCLILHTKGTFLIFLVFMLYYMFFLKNRDFKTKYIIYLLPILLYVFSYQVETYISNVNSVRMVLIINGLRTAFDYFPFGSGFSTYGTNEAALNYSPLYYKYGFDKMWGMGPDDNMFLNDGYIAGILGEEGLIGTLFFLLLVITTCRIVFSYKSCDLSYRAVVIGVFLCLLVSMTATGIFKSISGVFMMLTIGILFNNNRNSKKYESYR